MTTQDLSKDIVLAKKAAFKSGEFLLNLYPGEKNTREKLSTSIDNLNMRYGKRIINFGVHREHPGFFERE